MSALTGTIEWEVDPDSITNEFSYSQETTVGGMRWCICMRKRDDGYLAVGVARLYGDHNVVSVDIKLKAKLLNQNDESRTIKKRCGDTFGVNNVNVVLYHFIEWNKVVEDEGFIKDSKIAVKVRFCLTNIKESRKRRHVDFTDENEPFHDVTLVVGKEKFFVSKSYLSMISPVFYSMFYREFEEKKKKEIELKEIDPKEFADLLNAIYPQSTTLTENNFEYLLKLADRYEIGSVIDQVERFLIQSTSMTVAEKLVHAGRYRLGKLQAACIDELKTIKQITDVKKTKESKNFSDAINLALFEKVVKISD